MILSFFHWFHSQEYPVASLLSRDVGIASLGVFPESAASLTPQILSF